MIFLVFILSLHIYIYIYTNKLLPFRSIPLSLFGPFLRSSMFLLP
jgi:hypothetical protein